MVAMDPGTTHRLGDFIEKIRPEASSAVRNNRWRPRTRLLRVPAVGRSREHLSARASRTSGRLSSAGSRLRLFDDGEPVGDEAVSSSRSHCTPFGLRRNDHEERGQAYRHAREACKSYARVTVTGESQGVNHAKTMTRVPTMSLG